MIEHPYTAREVAELLGMSLERLYLRRRRLQLIDKMPAPIATGGRHAWHRGSFDAWLERHHPARRAGAQANDNTPQPVPASIDEHRAHLREIYGAT